MCCRYTPIHLNKQSLIYSPIPSILIEWVNDELHSERIIVQDIEEDLYDGQVINIYKMRIMMALQC